MTPFEEIYEEIKYAESIYYDDKHTTLFFKNKNKCFAIFIVQEGEDGFWEWNMLEIAEIPKNIQLQKIEHIIEPFPVCKNDDERYEQLEIIPNGIIEYIKIYTANLIYEISNCAFQGDELLVGIIILQNDVEILNPYFERIHDVWRYEICKYKDQFNSIYCVDVLNNYSI